MLITFVMLQYIADLSFSVACSWEEAARVAAEKSRELQPEEAAAIVWAWHKDALKDALEQMQWVLCAKSLHLNQL